MTRRRFSERDVIETLAHQGIFVCCYRCGEPFFELEPVLPPGFLIHQVLKIEREHLHEIALNGPDTPRNCRYSCGECHKSITNGTKATTAGSSKNRVAKANNPGRKVNFTVNKLPPGTPRQPSAWGARKLTASRPFPPRGARPMNRKRRRA